MFRVPKEKATVAPRCQLTPPRSTNCLSKNTVDKEKEQTTNKKTNTHSNINDQQSHKAPEQQGLQELQELQEPHPAKQQQNRNPTAPLLYQTNLTGKLIKRNDLEAFGDNLLRKPAHTFRIMLQNINNMSSSAHHYASRQIVDCITKHKLDAYLMTEVGLCWPKLSEYDQWSERTLRKVQHHKSIFGFNTTQLEHSKRLQPGGVGICATDEAVHRVISSGQDPSGLGRWAWIRMQGKAGRTIWIATAYRPCHGTGGAETVWEQH
jgi:hypothetical protein